MRKHNFNAGPSVLPEFTLETTAKAVMDFANSGMSIMEISHRSKEYDAVNNEAAQLVKELLNVPAGYSVVFMQGGASLQFAMIPFNFHVKKAAYLITGSWASKSCKEAELMQFGEVVKVASSKDKNFTYIPKNFTVPADADYFHITTNNTIYGSEILKDLDVNVPLIADMSSDIFSRPIDVSKYALIYAGAQKNLGPAGVTLVIIKDEFLNKMAQRPIPTMLNYKTHVENASLYNTPPCIAIFASTQTLKWLKNNGGIAAMEKVNISKSQMLYDEIDRNKLFKGTVEKEDRSRMSVCFVMNDEYKELEAEFLEFTKGKGMVGLKGHRSVGGFRASLYNALPVDSVKALVAAMQEFEKQH